MVSLMENAGPAQVVVQLDPSSGELTESVSIQCITVAGTAQGKCTLHAGSSSWNVCRERGNALSLVATMFTPPPFSEHSLRPEINLYTCILFTATMDYTFNVETLTFGSGSSFPTSMTFEVTLNDEQLVEANEAFSVNCQVLTGNAEFDNGQPSDTATVTILNDDCKIQINGYP